MTPRNLILILATSGFASTFSSRAVEPMVGVIARDLGTDVQTAALLSAAFALPYAFIQPILGPVGDAVGKERVMKVGLILALLALAASFFAPDIRTLFILRVVAGAAAGGAVPMSLALIGDRVPMESRQLALSRYLVAVITGQLAGSSLAGLLAELGRMARGLCCLDRADGRSRPAPRSSDFAALSSPASSIFRRRCNGIEKFSRNPRALALFSFVFVEATAIFGIFPYVAPLLERTGGSATQAGVALGGFALGGLIYSLLVSWMLRVPRPAAHADRRRPLRGAWRC